VCQPEGASLATAAALAPTSHGVLNSWGWCNQDRRRQFRVTPLQLVEPTSRSGGSEAKPPRFTSWARRGSWGEGGSPVDSSLDAGHWSKRPSEAVADRRIGEVLMTMGSGESGRPEQVR
jgi:hypothetical protein